MFSFVIPVKNDAERLRQCLRRIAENTPRDVRVEVIVADNGSSDGSADVARRAGATVLSLPGLSVGELRNRAAAAATGDILAFVDADHEIAPGWIETATAALAIEGIGGAGAPCHPPSPPTWVQRFYDRLRRHPSDREPVEWLGSGNLAVRRTAFDEVGGFDATLETCEDVDLCRKLRGRGYGLLSDHRMRNVHHGDPRTLGQVFFGEMWRGRDNVRVSLRPPLSARTLVSAALPVANLVAAGLLLSSVFLEPTLRGRVALAAVTFLILVIMLRVAAMLRPGWISDWPKAVAVAAAYEAGRSLALTGLVGHGRRRRAAVAS